MTEFIGRLTKGTDKITIPKRIVEHKNLDAGDLLRIRVNEDLETIVCPYNQGHQEYDSKSLQFRLGGKFAAYADFEDGETVKVYIMDIKKSEEHDYNKPNT